MHTSHVIKICHHQYNLYRSRLYYFLNYNSYYNYFILSLKIRFLFSIYIYTLGKVKIRNLDDIFMHI